MALFIVNNLNDSGAGSLRQAVLDANATAGADTITFSVAGNITLFGGEMALTDDVTIEGDINNDGRGDVGIFGNNATRIFHQTGGTTDVDLISLRLSGGNANAGNGGAILVEGNGGTLDIIDSSFSANAAGAGGAVTAGTGTKLSVTNSRFSGNFASDFGGAIYGFASTITLSNTTIDQNSSNGVGGGLSAGYSTLTISNSTITRNGADDDGASTTDGGGIDIFGSTLNLRNTVIADNTSGTGGTEHDVLVEAIGGGGTINATNNVFGTTVAINGTNVGNQQNVADVGLGSSANNSGATNTRNINPDSVLINAGSNSGAPFFDANGAPRNMAGTVDVGATEFKLVVTTLDDVVANDGLLSLREAVALANAGAGADVITFANGLSGTIALGSELSLTTDITIDGDTNGDNRADITLSGRGVNRIINQSGTGTDVTLLSLEMKSGFAGQGGAIKADTAGGTLVIQDSTLAGNNAAAVGGAIQTHGTNLAISSSLLLNNSAFAGGAIYAAGDFAGPFSTTTITNSTLQGNVATGGAGADGGAIIVGMSNTLNISNSTITENRGNGGAIHIYSAGSTINVSNSVVAGNLTSDGSATSDVAGNGTIDTATNSVFGTTVTIGTNVSSLQNVTNLGLGTLGLHGGTVQTREIESPTSVLLNGGSNAAAAGILTDANGNPRIQGGTVDIGASESNTLIVTNLNDSGAGSLRDAVDKANARAGVDHIVFQQGLSGTITLGGGHLSLTGQVSISGDTNGDGGADITLIAAQDDFSIYVGNTGTAELTSLKFADSANLHSVGAITNRGTLTLAYSVISGNAITPSGLLQGDYSTPIMNFGTMVVNQTLFANNSARGDVGYDGNGAGEAGRAGGFASASIFNFTGASLTTTALALVGGSAIGGNGGAGGNAQNPGGSTPNNGYAGGNGGAAAIGVLNLGTMSGTYSADNLGTATGGSGGTGGAGINGGAAGANGANGQSYTGNLNIGGTGVLNTVNTGTNGANVFTTGLAVTFYGMGGNDFLTAGTDSHLFGGSGQDTLVSQGNSVVRGGLGSDFLRNSAVGMTGSNAGIWDGGAGNDTFDASGSLDFGYGLYADLSTGVTNKSGTLLNIENIIGTNFSSYNDRLTGTSGANVIEGRAGIDNIFGLGGDDLLAGGADGDFIDGGVGGSDTADYRTSNGSNISISLLADTASGGDAAGDALDNIENLWGSLTKRDVLIGDNGNNILKGFGGTDSLRGEGGDDYLDGGAGADALNAGAGVNDWAGYRDNTSANITIDLTANTASGGDAQGDTLFFVENLEGSLTRRDILIGNLLVNTLIGNGGNDSIRGEGGNDIIEGGTGADSLNAGAGIDTVVYANSTAGVTIDLNVIVQTSGGEANGDSLFFFENITGSAFNDSLSGNIFSNRILGGAGQDTLNGALGSDYLTGGADADTFRFSDLSFGSDTILDWQDGLDKISIALPLETSFSGLTFTGQGSTQVVVKGFNGTGSAIIVKADAGFTLDVGDFIFV